jgi:hypothetical protein
MAGSSLSVVPGRCNQIISNLVDVTEPRDEEGGPGIGQPEEVAVRARGRGVRLVAAVLLLGIPLVGLASPVHAASDSLLVDVPGDGQGFVNGSSTPLLDFADLEPGDVASGTIGLFNDFGEPVELGMGVIDLVDGERGCPEPESNEGGDTTCSGDEGELSEWLRLSVTKVGDGHEELLWSGDFDALGESQVLTGAMPAAAQWDVRIDVELLPQAGNDTMTDAVAFSMSWSARGDRVAGEAVVAGVEAFRPGGGATGAGVELPFTGVTVEPWLIWFAAVLVSGGALLLGSRRLTRGPAHVPGHRARPSSRSAGWPWGIQTPLPAAAPTHRGRR